MEDGITQEGAHGEGDQKLNGWQENSLGQNANGGHGSQARRRYKQNAYASVQPGWNRKKSVESIMDVHV